MSAQLHLGTHPGGLILGAIEALIGFSFITGIWDRIGSVVLVASVLLGFLLFQPLDVLSQLHWVGMAVVIFVIGLTGIAITAPALSLGRLALGCE